MAKRAFKAAEVMSDEAKRELEALRRGLVDDSSVNSESNQSQQSQSSNAGVRTSSANSQPVAGKELLYDAPAVVSITTMGLSGLLGIAVRVFDSDLGPVPVCRLFNKRQIELEVGDWILMAHIGADLRGLVTVYRCESTQLPGRALLRRSCLIGPDGKFYPQGAEAFVPEEARGRLVILSKQALNAALREMKKSLQFQPRQHQPRQPRQPRPYNQPRHQYQHHRYNPRHNPYNW